jgi:tetratricopeptide (TPR) repeat protein
MALFTPDPVDFAERAFIYEAMQKYDLAIADITREIKMNGNAKSDDLRWRARDYETLGQYNKAIEDLTAVIADDPRWADNYRDRAWVYQKANQFDQALKDFDTFQELEPSRSSYASECRAQIYEDAKDYPGALDSYTKAIKGWDLVSDPEGVASLYFERAGVYLASQRFEDAIVAESNRRGR